MVNKHSNNKFTKSRNAVVVAIQGTMDEFLFSLIASGPQPHWGVNQRGAIPAVLEGAF